MLIKNIYLLVICLTWVQLAQAQSTSFQWGKQIGGDSSTAHKFIDFKTDLFGNTYSLGYFSGTVDLDPGPATYHLSASGNFGFYILKLNASGNFAWAKSISNSDIAIANSLCVDGFGNVYTTGYFTTVTDFDPSNGKYVL
ncbi:MAG: hypothetical protein PSX81_00260 [bacterium]|nr:hypothetical protein [bacterium]